MSGRGPRESAKHDALDTYLSLARGGGAGGGGEGGGGGGNGSEYALAAVEAIAGWLAEVGGSSSNRMRSLGSSSSNRMRSFARLKA